MTKFTAKNLAHTVHFGAGMLQILPELLHSYTSIMLIASRRLEKQVAWLEKALPSAKIHWFDAVVQHVPEALVQRAAEVLVHAQPQVLVAMGGGSAVGLAKALAKSTALPIVAIPTTYAGSEMTNIWGITSANGKQTGRDDLVMPLHVLYDPDLTAKLRPKQAASSAMNAMAHLMEGIYAIENNPATYQMAVHGLEVLSKALQALAAQQQLLPAINADLLYGAYLGGKVLGEVPMALHHKAAHVLGGSFKLEHADVHTVMQAFVLEFQWPHLPKEQQLAFQKALQHEKPWLILHEIAKTNHLPTKLQALGMSQEQALEAANIMAQAPYPNPAPLTTTALQNLMLQAWNGY